jgi:CDP-paratose 2-epimerase
LEKYTGKKSQISFEDWRPSDQKVFSADIRKAKEKLGWEPKINVEEGVKRLAQWTEEKKALFK